MWFIKFSNCHSVETWLHLKDGQGSGRSTLSSWMGAGAAACSSLDGVVKSLVTTEAASTGVTSMVAAADVGVVPRVNRDVDEVASRLGHFVEQVVGVGGTTPVASMSSSGTMSMVAVGAR